MTDGGPWVYSDAILNRNDTQMKSLRLEKHWSQEELAQLSGLNVRTIQRLEKGHTVGAETLKSLAAVFEISTNELLQRIEQEKQGEVKDQDDALAEQEALDKANEKVKAIKFFYASTAFLVATFLLFMLPNYNDGENLGPLVVVFLCFAAMIAGHAFIVFEPFGEQWEKRKTQQILKQQRLKDNDSSDRE